MAKKKKQKQEMLTIIPQITGMAEAGMEVWGFSPNDNFRKPWR